MTIAYTLKRFRRSKCMRIIVRSDGEVVVTSPLWVRVRDIEEFVHGKADWIKEKQSRAVRAPRVQSRAHYVAHKEQARALITQRVHELNAMYGFSFNAIAIRNQKTCWGSCSSKRNLNFNYRLLFLQAHLVDYVIVHELCHLKEMNHSRAFWNLVAQALPDYRSRRAELRSLHTTLHTF